MRHPLAAGLALGSLLLTGCPSPSLNQIRAFGSASTDLADNAREAFELVDRSTVDRRMYDIAADPQTGVTQTAFVSLFDKRDSATGEKVDALKVRLQLLSQLGGYSKALEDLASADFQKGINDASKDLYGSLSGLSQTYKQATNLDLGITQEQLGLFATAIASLGDAAAEKARRDALRTIIIASDPAVQKAAALIESELGKDSELARFASSNLENMQGSLQQAYNLQRTRPESTFQSRLAMLEEIRKLDRIVKGTPAFFEDVSAGARKLADAHAVLKKAVEAGKLDTAEVVTAIGELATRAKAAKSFREALEQKNP
jgi:hypothetical protein